MCNLEVHNVIKYPTMAACLLEASARTTLGHLQPTKRTAELAIFPVPFTPASAHRQAHHHPHSPLLEDIDTTLPSQGFSPLLEVIDTVLSS